MCRRQLPLMLLFCVTIAGVARFATAHVHPAMERFMQRDPLEHVDGPNFYVYVRDNPIRLTDPSGLVPSCLGVVREPAWWPKPGPGAYPYCPPGTGRLVSDRLLIGGNWVSQALYCLSCVDVHCTNQPPPPGAGSWWTGWRCTHSQFIDHGNHMYWNCDCTGRPKEGDPTPYD
jgi:hypothetical protein